MIAGRKRGRDEVDDVLLEEVTAAIQSVATETEDIVGSVGKVNGAVLASLLERFRQMEVALNASGGSAVQLWKLIVQSQRNRVADALNHIAVADDARRKGHLIATLQEQLLSSTSLAAEGVSSGLCRAHETAVALFSSQLAGERETNNKLILHVQELLRHSLEAIQVSSRRAMKAELLSFKRDILVARLQSSLSFYQNASLRQHEEVMALIKIVRILASKGKDADLAETKLRQAKTHVKLLENHLELAGIVEAILPPKFVPPRQCTEPPNEDLKRTAPEYFALRLLEHKDMTLSELVDSWQKQEARIIAAEEKYRELELSLESLRRESLTVHQGFLEEKRRREVVEQRLVDLVRERIRPSSNDALVQQLTLLRADHTKALDDLAQMATLVNVTRERLFAEQQRNALLEKKLQQMQDDSANDEVANTLASLRHYYEEELDRFRNGLVDADTRSAVAVASSEIQQKASKNASNALMVTEQTVMDMSAALNRVEKQLLIDQEACGFSSSERIAESAVKVLAESEMHLNRTIPTFKRMIEESEIRQEKDMASFERQVKQLLESLQSLLPTVSHSEVTTGAEIMMVQQQQEVQSMMREALVYALQFVSDNLVTNEISKTSLLDTSISDARQISLLFEKVQKLTVDRDAALERLARCERIIDQHSLTAVERVLMHEVPVEESLDAMEAAEQITTLRKEVSSLGAARTAALAELKELRKELKENNHEKEFAMARFELLEHHNSRLIKSIEECLAREVVLIEQVHQLQRNLQEGKKMELPVLPTSDSNETTEMERFMPLMQQLEQLTGGINEMKEQLSQVQRVIFSSPAAEGDVAEKQLLCNGVRQVADALREALQHAELFRHALPFEVTKDAALSIVGSSAETMSNIDGHEKAETISEPGRSVADAPEMDERDEELVRLRSKVETHEQIEQALRKHERDLQEQNEGLQAKIVRLLQINRQLLEELKTTRASSTTSANKAPQG
ncbi:hypothetical protein TcG_02768 [Trypanosoma cruzi]|nr:hypothetical protein TcG_02768 [Trypanosoma cruzi]